MVETTLERAGRAVRFLITAPDPLHQERLEHLGYQAVGHDRFATLWFADSLAVPRHFQQFTNSIEQLVLQSARLVPVPWEQALEEFLRRAERSQLGWWLYGSGALAARGLPIMPGDIDINVDDAFLAAEIFEDLVVTPVTEMQGWAAKRFCRAFCGAIFEWLSEPHPELEDPASPHEQGPLIADHIQTVTWRGHQVHVPPLSAQLAVSERRGLTDRAELIRTAMRDDPSTAPASPSC